MRDTIGRCGAVLLLLTTGCTASPLSLLRQASGSVSQTLCTKTFVSGLDPEAVYREHLRPQPGMGLVSWALSYDVDRDAREVRAHIAGAFERRSVFHEGRGCTLVYPDVIAPSALRPRAKELTPTLERTEVAEIPPASTRLRAALDAAFDEPAAGPARATKAVVVVQGHRVIAERYASGYGPTTPFLGHSLAKSVVNALIGVLVRQGKLELSQRPPIAASADSDALANLTIDRLLRMDAGMGADEDGGPAIATRMWFDEPDTAAFASSTEPRPDTTEQWGYSSRSYVILSRVLRDVIGEPQELRDFAERELLAPLGMRSVTLEFDATGTLMGAHAMLASPRDWARFGELYLHDGVMDGRRILPDGWVDYSTRPTPGTGYGAGFWLNTTHSRVEEWGFDWGLPGAPPDAFMARGYLGQYVVIVPSADLVIVRLGQSHARGWEYESVGKLVHDVIEATRP